MCQYITYEKCLAKEQTIDLISSFTSILDF